MYLDYYGLKEEPFGLTPDPKYFYTSRKHIEVLSCLQYTIEYRKGFGILIGEAGSGKTTVGHVLLKKLDPSTRVAVITNTHLDERELIYTILSEFGEEVELEDKCILLSKLNDFLMKELSRGGNPVLIIDEAQNLSPKVLEEIRMLANLETESEKLIQIILMGQPELEMMLRGDRLIQLQQRFSVGVRLSRLDLQETREYITFRMRMAGATGDGLFTDDAIDIVYEESNGIPRFINNICDACLVNAYAIGKRYVDGLIAREIVEERRRLFVPETDDKTVPGWSHEYRTEGSLFEKGKMRRQGLLKMKRHSVPAPGTGNYYGRKSREDFMSWKSPVIKHGIEAASREKVETNNDPNNWLAEAFAFPNPEELLKPRRTLDSGNLKIASGFGGEDLTKALLMERKPRRVKESTARDARTDYRLSAAAPLKKRVKESTARDARTDFRLSAAAPLKKIVPRIRKRSEVDGKAERGLSASGPFAQDFFNISAKRKLENDEATELLFNNDEELVLISGEDL